MYGHSRLCVRLPADDEAGDRCHLSHGIEGALVIDRDGDETALLDLRAYRDLAHRMAPLDVVRFLAVNAGLVVVIPRQNSLAIYMRPKFVRKLTLVGLGRTVARHPVARVSLEYYQTGWQHSVVGRNQILPVIDGLLTDVHGWSKDRIRRTTIDPRDSAGPFQELIALWRDKKDNASRQAWRPYLTELNGGSFQWTRPVRNSRKLEIVEVGRGMPRCAQRWLAHARLLSLDDHPDPHYANYCRQTYWSAAERGEASLETLDLMVDWPTFGLTRRRFHRLLLPVETGEGQLLLGTTLLDETIDLRRTEFHSTR